MARQPLFCRLPRRLLISAGLTVLTLTVYLQSRGHEFVNYEDGNFMHQPQVEAGLTGESLTWAFATTRTGTWQPLTWISLQLDSTLFGPYPLGLHLTSVLLHLANTLLLFWVLQGMTGAVWRSAFVAALFALHPLQVESVAWVAERKSVLGALFWMLSLWAYLHYVKRPSPSRYLMVMAAFSLGLLATPMLVTLPLVLVLLDYWPLQRRGKAEGGRGKAEAVDLSSLPPFPSPLPPILEKVPLLALALVSCVVTLITRREAVSSPEALAFPSRGVNAPVTYVTYLLPMILPMDLAVYYPRQDEPFWKVAGAGLLMVGVTLWAWRCRRQRPYLLVGWLWYLITVAPLGPSARSDHDTYLPVIGVWIILSWGLADLATRWRWPVVVPSVAAGLVLLGCGVVSWRQLGYWQDSISLWEHTVQVTETDALAGPGQGNALAHYYLGLAHAEKIELGPAIEHFSAAVHRQPDLVLAHYYLGTALAQQGKPEAAIRPFQEALRLDPRLAAARQNLGQVYLELGQLEEAAQAFTAWARLKPREALGYDSVGLVRSLQGKWREARGNFQEAVNLEPHVARYQADLGHALQELGEDEASRVHFQEALRLDPHWLAAANVGAWHGATYPDPRFRRAGMAARMARQICAATEYRNPDYLDTLAAAYAEAGRFEEARQTAQQALSLVAVDIHPDWIQAIQDRLEKYENHQPFRDLSGGPGKWPRRK